MRPDACFGRVAAVPGPRPFEQLEADAPRRGGRLKRMAVAAREEAGLFLSINGAFRSDAEQARFVCPEPQPSFFSALLSPREGAAPLLSPGSRQRPPSKGGLPGPRDPGSPDADLVRATPPPALSYLWPRPADVSSL